jgi:hypothetical protein
LTRRQEARSVLPGGRQPPLPGGRSKISATLAVRHHVQDYAAWREVYDEAQPLRTQYGCTAQRVMQVPGDADDLFVTHDFSIAEQAAGFAHDLALRAGMEQAGVQGAPQIEIFTDA